jgi:nitrogen fixation protein FixH
VTGGRPLTGRAVLAISLGAFAVVLGANIALVWFALGTFSGVAVDNSYVASQTFDRDREAQEALGWSLTLEPAPNALRLELRDAGGAPVRPAAIALVVGRPASARTDREVTLEPTPSGYAGAVALEPGAWLAMVEAVAADGTAFRQRIAFEITAAP